MDDEIAAINDDDENLNDDEEDTMPSTKWQKTGSSQNHPPPSIPFWKGVDLWLKELTVKWGTSTTSAGWKKLVF